MRIGKKSLIGIVITVLFVSMLILFFVPVKTEIFEPDCENDGYSVKTSVFGVKYTSNIISAIGHQFNNGVCINCGSENEFVLEDVKFVVEDKVVNEISVAQNTLVQVSLIINNDTEISNNLYSASWTFKEVSSELYVSSTGLVSVGNLDGKATLVATVSAKNTITVELPIIIESESDDSNNFFISFNEGNIFVEGQVIKPGDFSIWEETDSGKIQILDYIYNERPLQVGDRIFSITCKGVTIDADIMVLPKQLQRIEVVQVPITTEYYIGQYFNATGMVVMAYYEYLEEEIQPAIELRPLELEDKEILITYTYGGVTKSVSQSIVVLPKRAIDIESVEILIDDIAVTEYTATLPDNKFLAKVKVNNGQELSEEEAYSAFWSFGEEDYGSSVSGNGEVTLGDFLGETTLTVTVVGSNKMSATLHINVVHSEDMVLSSLTAIMKDSTVNFIEGQYFSEDCVVVWGWYDEMHVRILNFEYDEVPLTLDTTEVLLSFEGKTVIVPITVTSKSLQSIEIITPPALSVFYDGQVFDATGMVVKANYEYVREEIEFVFDKTPLCLGDSEVVISYTYQGITKTTTQLITVIPKKLLSIVVDDTNVRKYYTKYDVFNPQGLIVKANYDYFGEVEVFDYEYSMDPLLLTVTKVQIVFREGAVTKTTTVDVTVSEPYEKIVELKVLNPTDVDISWVYTYNSEAGEQQIDNTNYISQGLIHDNVNGIYEIPVGATVIAYIRNPAVNAIIINGVEQSVDYLEKSCSWVISDVDNLSIGSVEMSGRYYVIRFMGDNKDQGFLFEKSWSGKLSINDLYRLGEVYADNEIFYYSYLYDGKSFFYDDLSDVTFSGSTVVSVIKNTITSVPITVRLHLNDDVEYMIILSENEVENWDISSSIIVPAGYLYDGLATVQDGVKLSAEEIQGLLLIEDSLDLYIRLIPEIVDYSDKYIVQNGSSFTIVDYTETMDINSVKLNGFWEVELNSEGRIFKYSILLNGDGSFEYMGYIDGVLHCNYSGKYRLSGNRVLLISVETDMDLMVLNNTDFSIEAYNYGIKANLVVVLNDTIEYSSVQFSKVLGA